jgi:hypothetical protein
MNDENIKKHSYKKVIIFIVSFIIIILVLQSFVPRLNIDKKPGKITACRYNLKHLGLALKVYTEDNSNTYPTPDKWCDLLISEIKVSPKSTPIEDYLHCPGAKEGKCNYAMNPNCKPNSPRDTVLLFDTKGGWNQSGGYELLTTENHSGKGCCILFNNGSYEFIEKDKIAKLKW